MWYRVILGRRIALMSLSLLFAPFGLVAAESPGKLPPEAMAGQVVDPAGKPAVGAMVWLVGDSFDEEPKTLDKTTTDAQGRFVFPDAKSKYIAGKSNTPHLVVRDSQGRLGWNPCPWAWQGDGSWTPHQDFRIKLLAVHEYRGRLLDGIGQPIAKAIVCPRSVAPDSIHAENHWGIGLPPELAKDLASETDADGRFVLRGVPPDGSIVANVTASGFGTPQVAWDLKDSITLRLDKAGHVRGTLVVPPGAAALDTLRLRLYTASAVVRAKDAAFGVSYCATAFPDKDGHFQFDNVPPATYTINPDLYESVLPYYAKEPTSFEVKPSATASAEVRLLPAIAVRGQVVDAETGHGIQGISVGVAHLADKGHWNSSRQATTGADGRFMAYTEPGQISVYAGAVSNDYLNPARGSESTKTDAAADFTWPTIKLQRAARLKGVVVDEAGKPVPDVEVQSLRLCSGMPIDSSQNTDSHGQFSLKGLDPKNTLSLRARSAEGVSNVLELRPADLSAPVRLVLSKQNAFALKGVCVDEAGQPIRQAEFSVSSVWMLGPTGIGIGVESGVTDSNGRFAVARLWPGFHYELNVTADGYAKYQSQSVTGQVGQSYDFGKIVLVDQGGFVEGTVIDSAGKPLAGVHVFHHRDAAKHLSTTTDAAGRFRIDGLRSGRAFVCAEKNGYRLKVVATAANTKGVSVTLLRSSERVPRWKPRRPPASFAEEQAVARKLLDKLYAVPQKGPNSWSYRFIARLDPSRALQWSKEVGGRFDGELYEMVAKTIAETDVEESIALLTPRGDYRAFLALKSLAECYAVSDVAKAERLVEEATLLARQQDQPNRAIALAQAGKTAVLLGKVESGRKLIGEAADMAAKMGATDRSAYYRRNVASALAPQDFARAMSLVEPLSATEKDEGLAAIATAIAPQDLDRALKMLSQLDKKSTLPDNARFRIAFQLATTRPKDAIRAVESMNTFGAKKNQADAYARLAVVIAPHDPQLAWSLIDRSFVIFETNVQEMRSWSHYGNRGAFAAHAITQAHEIGYPDMGLLIDRALAMRPTEGDESELRGTQKNTVFMAAMLALVDPDTGKTLLETVSPRYDGLKDFGHPGAAARDWLQAWTLADFTQLAGTLERQLDAARTNPNVDIADGSLDQILDLLTTPVANRVQVLDHYTRAFWFLHEDD